MFKYVLKKMSKEREAIPFIIMILLSFSISTVSPYLMEAYFFEENVLWLMIILMHCQIRIVEKS